MFMTFHNEPQAMAMSFMRGYGEPFEWLKEVFRDWAFTFLCANMYHRGRERLDQDTLNLYRRGLACFDGNAPSYHLELQDHPVIVWDFHSLMLAVRFLFSLKMVDVKNPLRMCGKCYKAFYAHRTDAQYCSAECRNKANKKP